LQQEEELWDALAVAMRLQAHTSHSLLKEQAQHGAMQQQQQACPPRTALSGWQLCSWAHWMAD